MKTIIPLAFYAVTVVCGAQPIKIPFNAVLSQTQKNVFVVFSVIYTKHINTNEVVVFPINENIQYGFGSVGVYRDVLALDDEYSYIISAKSESGRIVQKTDLGERFGAKFHEVSIFDRKLLDFNKSRGTGGYKHPYISIAESDGIVFSRSLPPLKDLFKFEKPGRYNVSVQIQCFVSPFGKADATNVCLARFPPVDLIVEKGEDDIK